MLCLSLTGCPTTCSPSLLAHLFVIPLEHDQLLPQGLVLTLKVHFGPGHLVQHLLQSSNVWLHGHPHGQLVLIPEGTNRSERLRKKLPVRHDCMLWGACEVSLMLQGREGQRMHSLHLEIIGSQFCVVDVQECLGIEPGGNSDLRRRENRRSTSENIQFQTVWLQYRSPNSLIWVFF